MGKPYEKIEKAVAVPRRGREMGEKCERWKKTINLSIWIWILWPSPLCGKSELFVRDARKQV